MKEILFLKVNECYRILLKNIIFFLLSVHIYSDSFYHIIYDDSFSKQLLSVLPYPNLQEIFKILIDTAITEDEDSPLKKKRAPQEIQYSVVDNI